MTNDDFREWRSRHFISRAAAAAYLDMDRDTIEALETGATKRGNPYPVRHHVALACLAIERGLVALPKKISTGTAPPAPGRRQAAQTEAILARADGTMTVAEIAADMKIDRKPVYAAIAAARKKGRNVAAKPAS